MTLVCLYPDGPDPDAGIWTRDRYLFKERNKVRRDVKRASLTLIHSRMSFHVWISRCGTRTRAVICTVTGM